MTKKVCSSLAALIFLLASWAESAEVVDACAAVVNQDVITVSEVEEAVRPLVERIKAEAPFSQRDEAMRQARKSVMDKLIEKHLILQQAEQMKISVPDAEVEAARKDILERGSMSEADFQAELKKMGLTERQYRDNLREQILSSRLVSYAVRSKVLVPEEKIRDYYEKQYTAKAAGYHLLQIGFDISGAGGTASARQKAEAVRQRALAGEDFKELARRHSELPSAADGGDIGVFKADEMAAHMRKAVAALQPGGISPVVETPDGLMLFKLLADGQDAVKAPYESVRQEIHELLHQQEMEARYKTWIEEIRSGAYIRIL
ncbi:MAG: peptidylprolyl isomerase [Candidatus Electronema sp. VV]